jgi:hypothetical protein
MFYVNKHGGLLFSPLPPHTRPWVDAVASDSVGGVVHHHLEPPSFAGSLALQGLVLRSGG